MWLEQDIVSLGEWVDVVDYLEAKEMQNQIIVSTFPHMKAAEQKKISANLSRKLNPRAKKRAMTTADLAGVLAKGGVGGK